MKKENCTILVADPHYIQWICNNASTLPVCVKFLTMNKSIVYDNLNIYGI